MGWENRKCFICGELAEVLDTMAKFLVKCPKCGDYDLTEEAKHDYLSPRKDGSSFFCDEQKQKLSEYVKKKSDATKKPVQIYRKTIEAVTRKRAIGIRYSGG